MKKKETLAALSQILESAMDAMAATVANNHEIVLHNLTTPAASVQKIINGHISGRKKGDSLLAGPDKDDGFAGLLVKGKNDAQPVVIKNYKTVTAAGRLLDSASTIYFSEEGEPLMAFCINTDNSAYEHIRKGLELLTHTVPAVNDKKELSLNTIISDTIQDVIGRHTISGKKIQKAQRLKIIEEIRSRGIFKMKGGVQQVADALGVTRYTIYNDLEAMGEE